MMITDKHKKGFNEVRSQMYETAINRYPIARVEDILAMKKYLAPKSGEAILGIGEGNGYFCKPILEDLGKYGRYLVTDPSENQLENLSKRTKSNNLEIQVVGAEDMELPPTSFDKVWSFGAFHHCQDQTRAMRKIYSSLKERGKAVICDVFQGSPLSKHFDEVVARYCLQGHEVKFLSDEFARSLCYLSGFEEDKIRMLDLPQKWVFDSEYALGDFIYNLHGMTLLPGNEEDKITGTIAGCKRILGVKKNRGKFELNWPMKCLIAEK